MDKINVTFLLVTHETNIKTSSCSFSVNKAQYQLVGVLVPMFFNLLQGIDNYTEVKLIKKLFKVFDIDAHQINISECSPNVIRIIQGHTESIYKNDKNEYITYEDVERRIDLFSEMLNKKRTET